MTASSMFFIRIMLYIFLDSIHYLFLGKPFYLLPSTTTAPVSNTPLYDRDTDWKKLPCVLLFIDTPDVY